MDGGPVCFVLKSKADTDGVVAFGVKAADVEAFGED